MPAPPVGVERSGEPAVRRGRDALARLDLVRVNDRILGAAGILLPADVPSLDAIHLATAQQLGSDLGIEAKNFSVVTLARGKGISAITGELLSPMYSVPGAGFEPARPYGQRLLRTPSLPVPPSRP